MLAWETVVGVPCSIPATLFVRHVMFKSKEVDNSKRLAVYIDMSIDPPDTMCAICDEVISMCRCVKPLRVNIGEAELIRQAMSILGKRTSDRKRASSRRNAKKPRSRKKPHFKPQSNNLCSSEQMTTNINHAVEVTLPK